MPSSSASPVGEPNLDGVLRGALVDPPRPRGLEPRLLVGRPEAVLHSLSLLVRGFLHLPADQIRYPLIPLRQGVNWVRSPQLEARLILAGDLHTRVEDGNVLEAASKEEVFVKTTALGQTLSHPLLEAVLSDVGSMVETRTAGHVQVARQRRQEEYYQLLQELEDVQTILKIHVKSLLTCQNQFSLDMIIASGEFSDWQIPPPPQT